MLVLTEIVLTALSSGGARADEPAASSDAARVAYAAAAALQNREAWDLAAEQWRSLLEEHPADPLAAKGRYYLGICLLKSGREEDAQRVFREVASSRVDADTLGMARWELAVGAYRRADDARDPAAFKAAARALEDFIAAEPKRPEIADALHLSGEAEWQAGNRDRAIEIWRRFLERHAASPRLPEVLYALGLGLAETDRRDEAATILARFAKEYADHPLAGDVAIWRADVATAAGRLDEAEAVLAPLIAKASPRSPDALERVGDIRWKREDWKGAAAAYRTLAADRSDPQRGRRATVLAARALLAAGQPDEARPLFEQVVAAGGDEAIEAAHRLAGLELDAARPEAALAAASRGLALVEGDSVDGALVAAVELDRADALWEIPARREEAAEAYERVLTHHAETPSAVHAATMAAVALLESGDAEGALVRAERAIARQSELQVAGRRGGSSAGTPHAVRAEALIALGRTREAADAYHALVEAQPEAAKRPAWIVREAVALAAEKNWAAVRKRLADRTGLEGELEAESLYLEAMAAVELGAPAEARPLLEALLSRHKAWPRRDEAALLAIRAAEESGDAKAALTAAERLVRDSPGGPNAAVAWYRLGQLRQEAGREDDAINAFTRSIEADSDGPRSAWAMLAIGWCHESRGRLPEAIAAWNGLVEARPDSKPALSALLARADARQRSGDFEGGLVDARAVVGRREETAERLDADAVSEARLVEGLCLAGLGRHEEAAAALFRLLKEHPRFRSADRALYELGVAESLAGRTGESRKAFAALHKHFPGSRHVPDAWLELGESHWDAKEWDEAAACYRSVIESASADTSRGVAAGPLVEQARHKLGWTHVVRGDAAAAAGVFADQLRDAPDGPLAADGHALLGDALLTAGRPQEAVGPLAAAVKDPGRLSSPALVGLAFVRAAESEAALGRWQQSLSLAERLLGEFPDSPRIEEGRYAAAWAMQNLGRLDEAIEAYRRIADASRTPLAARARLMEGEALFEQKRHGDAVKAFFKVAYGFGEAAAPPAYHPWQAQATFEAARCFEVLGKPDQAKALYEELAERYPDSQPVPAARRRLAALGRAIPEQEAR
jgi:TolA-binding protein/predicted negative regulator of RcsB-dependent stress response